MKNILRSLLCCHYTYYNLCYYIHTLQYYKVDDANIHYILFFIILKGNPVIKVANVSLKQRAILQYDRFNSFA